MISIFSPSSGALNNRVIVILNEFGLLLIIVSQIYFTAISTVFIKIGTEDGPHQRFLIRINTVFEHNLL